MSKEGEPKKDDLEGDQGRIFEAPADSGEKPGGNTAEQAADAALSGLEDGEAQDPVEKEVWFGEARKYFKKRAKDVSEKVSEYFEDRKETLGSLSDIIDVEKIPQEFKDRLEKIKKLSNGKMELEEEDKEFLKSWKADLAVLGIATYVKVTKFGILKFLWKVIQKKGKVTFKEGYEIGKDMFTFDSKKGGK